MYDTVLFDLDGTLTDPFEGITNSIVYALKKFGIEVEDKRTLIDFIGPPLVHSFMKYYGFDLDKANTAVEYYREYFAEKGLYENGVYDGITYVLSELKASGKRLIIATCKPEVFAVKILDHFDLTRYFDHIVGATLDLTRAEKTDVIKYAVKKHKISSAIMVGDRKHDVLGAKNNGLPCIGVTYGYGTKQELTSAGADYLADCPQDILQILNK
ncbi:MAG: HAD family hydrolase [Clostridia bacterium]|nr:HAD family hydrolase [Clostridia bacterium]